MVERKQLKLKLERTRSERVKQRTREQYKGKDREVKRSAREDKRHWLNGMAVNAESSRKWGNWRITPNSENLDR